jgi:transposase
LKTWTHGFAVFCVEWSWSTGWLVGMYLRVTSRKNVDGSRVRYVALAHNERVDGQTRARVLVNLGREDQLDADGLRRLVSSICRYLGDDGDPRARHSDAEPLRMMSSRALGGVWLLDGLWRQLEIDTALRQVLGPRRFTTDVERVLFALVANRALQPSSKLAATEWVAWDAAIPGLPAMSDDQAYRAMDLLVGADATARVQEAVFFAVANLLNLEVDVLLFDTTSTYFETDTPDTAADGRPGFRRYGHSKDHRPDLPQVIIGLAVTREGIPVRVWCWPGNTADTTVLPEVRDGMRDWKLGRVVTVVDRGFSSDANLDYLRRGGGGWIAGERMRDHSGDAAEALSRQGRFTAVNEHLHVKEARLDSTPGVRWIICLNTAGAVKDKATRDEAITHLQGELDRIAAARVRATTARKAAQTAKARTRLDAELAGHTKAECALRDHVTLGRWLRQTKTGRLVLDRSKIAAEERLDGKYLLSTSDPTMSPAAVALGYKNLLEAEQGFRDMKSTLMLRPVFHRLEPRIRAHVLICWLALLLARVAENKTGLTWERIARDMDRLHAITLNGPAGTVVQATEPTDSQRAIYTTCGVTPPPRITELHPA